MAFGSILLAVFGIGLLIFLHEGGHFLAARLAGVRVEVFSLGFGPRLGGFTWGGTDFRLSAVPFGGYVMVAGQDPSDRRYPAEECLWSKSVGQRALFWSGGVIMNLLFALIVFPIVFGAGVQFVAPVIGRVPVGSAAWEAGIRPGERLVEVAGKEVRSFENASIEVALSGNRPADVVLEDEDGNRREVTVRPHFDRQNGLYSLGCDNAFEEQARLVIKADGVAAKAGLRTGDVLLSINGERPALAVPIAGFEPIQIVYERGGEQLEATLTPASTTKDVPRRVGVQPLANRIEGIRPGCRLVEALGLLRDDHILAIDDRPFLAGDLAGYADGGADTRSTTTWLVRRDGALLPLEAAAADADARAELVASIALRNELSVQLMPSPDSPALAAGLQPGDWVRTIDGEPIDEWDDLKKAVERAEGAPMRFGLLRPNADAVSANMHQPAGESVAITIAASADPVPDFGWEMRIAPQLALVQATSFGNALKLGTVASVDLIKQLYVTMKRLLTGEVGAKNLGGIIRISQVSYRAAQRGPSWFWYFLGLLSVNLAFVNLLPIPVLDGGHLMFLLIEKVKGSPVSSKVFGYSQVIGLVFVLLLVLFVTYNDILRLL